MLQPFLDMELKEQDRIEEERIADAEREEELTETLEADPIARELGKDAVREMTDGQDRDVQDEPTVEEIAGPMHVSNRRELSRHEPAVEGVEPAAVPTAIATDDPQ